MSFDNPFDADRPLRGSLPHSSRTARNGRRRKAAAKGRKRALAFRVPSVQTATEARRLREKKWLGPGLRSRWRRRWWPNYSAARTFSAPNTRRSIANYQLVEEVEPCTYELRLRGCGRDEAPAHRS
jgi:hypothetical protein